MRRFIFLTLIIVISVKADSTQTPSPIPLNFFDAIQKFYRLRDRPVLSKNQIDQINKLASNKDKFIISLLEELTNFYFEKERNNFSDELRIPKLPNITTECSLQLVQWFIAITSKPPKLWALSGIS